MPTRGHRGRDMMFRTCTIQVKQKRHFIVIAEQVNLDYESEEDMIQKFRLGLALQPIATALFSNSPFEECNPNGYRSFILLYFIKYTDLRV